VVIYFEDVLAGFRGVFEIPDILGVAVHREGGAAFFHAFRGVMVPADEEHADALLVKAAEVFHG